MRRLCSLHAIAAPRGDGLHPVLLTGLKRLAAERAGRVVAECDRRREGAAEPTKDRAADEEIARPHRA